MNDAERELLVRDLAALLGATVIQTHRQMLDLEARMRAYAATLIPRNPGGVHNHGPEEGRGTSCTEYLIGQCQLDAVQAGATALKGYIETHRQMHAAPSLDCPMCEMEMIIGTKRMLGASQQQAVLGRDPS